MKRNREESNMSEVMKNMGSQPFKKKKNGIKRRQFREHAKYSFSNFPYTG